MQCVARAIFAGLEMYAIFLGGWTLCQLMSQYSVLGEEAHEHDFFFCIKSDAQLQVNNTWQSSSN